MAGARGRIRHFFGSRGLLRVTVNPSFILSFILIFGTWANGRNLMTVSKMVATIAGQSGMAK